MNEYAEKNNIPYDNRTINLIIQEHKEMKSAEEKESLFIDKISKGISKEINKEIRRIRLGTNNTDRNTQVIIELLNGLLLSNDVNDILTTDDLESKPVSTAKKTVQQRIENLQQKRADFYNKGGGDHQG